MHMGAGLAGSVWGWAKRRAATQDVGRAGRQGAEGPGRGMESLGGVTTTRKRKKTKPFPVSFPGVSSMSLVCTRHVFVADDDLEGRRWHEKGCRVYFSLVFAPGLESINNPFPHLPPQSKEQQKHEQEGGCPVSRSMMHFMPSGSVCSIFVQGSSRDRHDLTGPN